MCVCVCVCVYAVRAHGKRAVLPSQKKARSFQLNEKIQRNIKETSKKGGIGVCLFLENDAVVLEWNYASAVKTVRLLYMCDKETKSREEAKKGSRIFFELLPIYALVSNSAKLTHAAHTVQKALRSLHESWETLNAGRPDFLIIFRKIPRRSRTFRRRERERTRVKTYFEVLRFKADGALCGYYYTRRALR